MEKVLEQALPKEVIEVQEAVQEVVAPPDNRVRDFGILVGVVVLAAVCAKLYKCTAKK
tara:strand:+ start:200 stop:373 length:174 start_codon:yes stop_codon:yes gene_type:complete